MVCQRRLTREIQKLGYIHSNMRKLLHEEAPTFDTLACTFTIASCPAYVLIDTGATHSCICEDFMSACELCPEVPSRRTMSISFPLGSNSWTFDVVKSVDVVIDDLHMLVDMLVFFMSDFEVILGMDWLTW